MAGTVALSSLRVTADMDASGYARGVALKTGADAQAIASSAALGAALAQQDAALNKVVPGVTRLSRELVNGYGQGAQFEAVIRRIGNAVDRGMGLDRASLLLEQTYRKFGLTADAANLAKSGFVSIVPVIEQLNQHYSTQATALDRIVVAQNRATAAAQAQAAINQRLGVDTGFTPGAARSSADAFLANVGGLEGVARAQAQQIAQAFSTDLDTRLIAGVGKSARESASVFQTDFDRMDEIARQKAQQTGQAFGDDLNSRMIAGIAKSARDSAAVFETEFGRLDEIAKLKAQQAGQIFGQNLNESFGIGGSPKSAQDSAQVFQDFERQARAADDLRAKYDPLYAAQRNYLAALKDIKTAGADAFGGQQQYAAAITRTKDAFAQQIVYIQRSGMETEKFGRNISGIVTNLGYQVNDIVTGVLLGQSPFMIMAQQGGQVVQILGQSPVGVGGLLKQMGERLLGLVTIGRVAFGAIAGAIFLAISALNSFQAAQRETTRLLSGAGRASGAKLGDIENLAQTQNSPYGLSVRETRTMAAELASTGKIGLDAMAPLVAIGHDFAKTFGIDAATAAKLMADSFSDPIRGADELNKRLGFLDDRTRQLIASQVAQGDRQAAINTLIGAVQPSLAKAADVTSFWSRVWAGLTNNISNGYDALGRYLDRASGGAAGRSAQQQVVDGTIKLLDLQTQLLMAQRRPMGTVPGRRASELAAITAQIEAQKNKIDQLRKSQDDSNKASNDAKLAQRSLEIGALITAMVPGVEVTRKAADATKNLNEAMNSPELQQRIGFVDQLALAYGRWLAAQKASTGADPIKNQIAGLEDQIRALDQRSIEARRRFAEDAEKRAQSLDLNAGNEEERLRKQKLAGDLAAGGQTALDNVERQRIQTLGTLATVEDAVTAKQLDLNNANREGIKLTDTQILALRDLARYQAESAKLQQQAQFGIFDPSRQQANAQLQLKTLVDDGTIKNAQDYAAAQQQIAKSLENTAKQAAVAAAPLEGLQRLINEASDARGQLDQVGIGITNGISSNLLDLAMHTKTAADAFKDMSLSVIRSIMNMIIQMTIAAPIAKALMSILGMPFANGGAVSNGMPLNILPSARGNAFSGGNMIHPFALGGIPSDILYKPTLFPMARGMGLAGEAGPEAIMPLRRDSAGRLGVSMQGGGGAIIISPTYNVDARGSDMGEEKLMAILAQNNKRLAKTINDALPDRVAAINADPRRR